VAPPPVAPKARGLSGLRIFIGVIVVIAVLFLTMIIKDILAI